MDVIYEAMRICALIWGIALIVRAIADSLR